MIAKGTEEQLNEVRDYQSTTASRMDSASALPWLMMITDILYEREPAKEWYKRHSQ